MAFVSGMATSAIIFMSGCGVPADEVSATTDEIVYVEETIAEEEVSAIEDVDLKVDEKGNITDSKGNTYKADENGNVTVKTSDGKKIKTNVESVKAVNDGSNTVKKPTTANGSTGNKPSNGSNSTEATKKPVQKPVETQKPTQKPADPNAGKTYHEAVYKTVTHPAEIEVINHPAKTKIVTHPAVTHEEPIYENKRIYVCNTCNADITEAVKKVNTGDSSLMNAHMNPHYEKGEKTSWHSEYREVQVGTQTVVDKPAWEEKVVTEEAWTEERVIKEKWEEKVLVTPAGYY